MKGETPRLAPQRWIDLTTVTTVARPWFKRAQPPTSHASAIGIGTDQISLATEVIGFARPNHALACVVTLGNASAIRRDHGRKTVVQTGAAANLARKCDLLPESGSVLRPRLAGFAPSESRRAGTLACVVTVGGHKAGEESWRIPRKDRG